MDTTIKYPSHNDLVQWYYQLAQKISDSAGVTPEQVNDLIDAYIAEHPYPVVPDDIITQANAAANVVTSVNGEKGDVTVSGGGDVPDNVLTEDNIAQHAVTSFNGTVGAVKYTAPVTSVNGRGGDVTVAESPPNVVTTDTLGALAVLTFNGQTGYVSYTPPVTSVNGMKGDVYTPIYRSSETGAWAYGIRTNSERALIFARFQFTFEGIDISYNATIPVDLQIQPVTMLSWLPEGQSYTPAQGAYINYANRTIKIMVRSPDSVTPPESIWAGCILYGEF